MNHCRLVFAAFILVSSLASAEGQPSAGNQDGASHEKSLADVAKEAKQKKAARAKNTITDEDIANRSPLPRLNFEGVDNASDRQLQTLQSESEALLRQLLCSALCPAFLNGSSRMAIGGEGCVGGIKSEFCPRDS
jgi:hypothetical protein